MRTALAGKVAVVTGASSGIGWALAECLARHGCAVGLLARRVDRLDEVARIIRRRGGRVAVAAADVGQRAQVEAAVEQVRAELGPIDLMIANAGVGKPTHLHPVNLADVEEMFQVNVLGVVYALSAVLPEMLARRQGHLAAVSSLAGFTGLPGEAAYCASKAAVNTYLEGLRIQLARHHIAVTTICPGFVHTAMTVDNDFAMPGVMSAEAAAERIVTALARRRKVFAFPWQTRLLTQLTRWLPDRFVAWAMDDYNDKMQPHAAEAEQPRASERPAA